MFVFFYVLYTSAEPLNIFLTNDAPDPDLVGFLRINLLAATGLFIGLFASRMLLGTKWINLLPGSIIQERRIDFVPRNLAFIMLPLTIFLFGLYTRIAMVGFSLESIFSPYGSEGDFIGQYDLMQTLAGFTVISPVLFGVFVEVLIRKNPSKLIYLWLFLALIALLYFLARGNRNFATMLLLPLVTLYLSRRPVRLSFALFGILIAYIIFQFLAYARNFGLNNISSMDGVITMQEFAPSGSELGTSFNVYRKFQEISVYFQPSYGMSYTVDTLVNLIPRGLWPDRPYSLSEKFVRYYLATDDVTEGFGFSPLIESWINFGIYGCFFVFAAFGVLIAALDCWMRRRCSISAILGWSVLTPFVVNWNRIDFATCTKMYLIFIAFFVFFEKTTISRRKSKGLVGNVEQAEVAATVNCSQ
jgi:oligosaccharide repeat unit polymerase